MWESLLVGVQVGSEMGVLDELCAVGEDTAMIWRDWFLVSGKEEFEHLHGCRSWEERLLKCCRLTQMRWVSHAGWVSQFKEVSLPLSPPPVDFGACAELSIPCSSMVSRRACSSHGWWLEQVLRGLRPELPTSAFPITHLLGSLLKVLLQLLTHPLTFWGAVGSSDLTACENISFPWGISLSCCMEIPTGRDQPRTGNSLHGWAPEAKIQCLPSTDLWVLPTLLLVGLCCESDLGATLSVKQTPTLSLFYC